MRIKHETIKTPGESVRSWTETQIIETIRDAYSSNRSPDQLIRERALRRGGLSGPLGSRRTSITEKLSLVTVYRRKESFLRGLWRSLTGT